MKYVRLFLLLPVLALIGCQSLRSVVQEPELSLNSVDLAGISINGVDLIAHVDVENPNGFPIPLPEIGWELFINTAPFIKGTVPGGGVSGENIKGRDRVTLDLPVSLTYEGLYRSFASLMETKEAAYDIVLGIRFPVPVLESKVFKLDFSGKVPLPRMPVLSPGQVRISKIGFSGATVAWDVNVENPNGFAIPFPGIGWDYAVNGVSVLKGSLSGSGGIAAGAAATALISADIVYADVLRAAGVAADAGEAVSKLALDAGTPIPALDGVKSILDIPGTLPILRKPEVSFQGITRKSLGAAMEFILNWEVDNKNNFDFNVGEFIYDFKVNNSQWAAGRIANPPVVKANGRTVIPLTVSVSALSLVRELAGIISRDAAVNFNCTGNMSLSGNLPGLDKLELPLNFQGSTRIR